MAASPLFERTNFTGSFTDNLFTNDPLLCASNDNLLVDDNKKFYVRDGSSLIYAASPQPLGLTSRTQRLFKTADDSTWFGVNATQLWYDNGTGYTQITGPFTSAFPDNAAAGKTSVAEWKGHFLIANDEGDYPVKLYKDSGGVWRLRTAGLPAPVATYNSSDATALTNAIALANELRTDMKAHFTDTTKHADFGAYIAAGPTHRASDTVSDGLVAVAATSTLAQLLTLTKSLLRAYQNHFLDSGTAGLYHYRNPTDQEWIDSEFGGAVTPSLADFLPAQASAAATTLSTVAEPTTLIEAIAALNDLRKCYLSHEGSQAIHAGVPNTNQNRLTLGSIYDFSLGPLITLDRSRIYAYANLIKSKYNAHRVRTSGEFYHPVSDTVNTVAGADATTPFTLAELLNEIRVSYFSHNQDADPDAVLGTPVQTYHAGVTREAHYNARPPISYLPPASDLQGGVTEGNWADTVTELNVLKNAYNGHVIDNIAHTITSGLDASLDQIPGADLSLARYLYAFVYAQEYTVGTETFEDVSAPLLVDSGDVISIAFQGLAITNIPSLANTSVTNYNTSEVVVKIYRTANNGSVFYYVGEIANGTTTYTDYAQDEELVATNNKLYITGGVVDNDPPPIARCVHVVNNKAYYGYVTDAGQVLKNRVRESIVNDIDSCPADFYVDLDDAEVIGISSAKSIPIVFGSRSFHRLEGGFDELGRGSLQAISISDTVGCVSENSIVRTDVGVFFAGTDGFYWTDGYTYKKLSSDWDTTYATIAGTTQKKRRINGAYDPATRRIWWGAQLQTSATDCDTAFILDLNFPLDPVPTWTTASNTGHFNPTALLFVDGELKRGDPSNYLFKHTSALLNDAYIDSGHAGASWSDTPIRYTYTDVVRDFGQNSVRKWITWMVFHFRKETNINLMPYSRNDDTSSWQAMGAVEHLNSWVWGDPLPVWGDPDYFWNYVRGLVEKKRRFPANQIRCTYKQVKFVNNLITFKSSTEMGTATINSGGLTATLDDVAKSWPTTCVGQYLVIAGTSYRIRRRTSATVLLLESSPSSGSYSWSLQGYGKGEDFSVLGYTIYGAPQSVSQQASRPATGADV